MILALLVSLAAIAVGTGIGLLRDERSQRFTGPTRTFALVSVLVVVCARLLPDAIDKLGLAALGIFVVGYMIPGLLERVSSRSHPHDHRPFGIGLELGYAGLLLHKLGDGLVVGLYSSGTHGQDRMSVLGAIAAHTIPVSALMVLGLRSRFSDRTALAGAAGLGVATALGVGVAGSVSPQLVQSAEPWLTAIVSGLLMHVVGHGWGHRSLPTTGQRFWDFTAVLLGISLVLLGGEHEHAPGEDHAHSPAAQVGEAFVELLLETAPWLLIGLAIAALLQLLGPRLPTRWLRGGGTVSQAVRGAVVGAPIPVCACGVLPIAHALRQRGGGPALVVAFLLSTPELGIETFALTVRFLGWPFALARLGAALLAAVVAALTVGWVLRNGTPGSEEAHEDAPPPFGGEGAKRPGARAFMDHLDDLLFHIGPWTLLGLLAASYVQVALPDGSLASLAERGLDVPVVMLLAVPMYVCASSATPFAAVLLSKGLSTGAVLAGLLLGPATNIATFGWLRQSYGGRAALAGVSALVGLCWVLATLINQVDLPVHLALAGAGGHEHGQLQLLASALLGALSLRGVWRSGLQAWLGSLGESLATHSHDEPHSHAH